MPGVRYYDPEVARWNAVDPVADKYLSDSPYSYAVNQPLLFLDPDGAEIVINYDCNDEGKECKSWTFTGDNSSSAPDNTFVRQFLAAYEYIVSQVGDTSLEGAAHLPVILRPDRYRLLRDPDSTHNRQRPPNAISFLISMPAPGRFVTTLRFSSSETIVPSTNSATVGS